jgi:sugar phosphate isomerase/epimerase
VLRIRLAADLGPIDIPFQQSLDRVRKMQLDGVELDLLKLMPLEDFTRTAIREIRKSLSDRNLSLAAVRYRTPRGLHYPTGIENYLDNMKKSMELTYQLGGNVTIVSLGLVPRDQKSLDWQILREIIQELCRFSERAGSVAAAETDRSPPEAFVALLDGIPEGRFWCGRQSRGVGDIWFRPSGRHRNIQPANRDVSRDGCDQPTWRPRL